MLLKVAFNQTKPNQSIIFLSGTTSQQGNLVKKYDNKDYIRNIEIVLKASKFVGIIRGPETSGTGFRVGKDHIMMSLHVLDKIMSMYIHSKN